MAILAQKQNVKHHPYHSQLETQSQQSAANLLNVHDATSSSGNAASACSTRAAASRTAVSGLSLKIRLCSCPLCAIVY